MRGITLHSFSKDDSNFIKGIAILIIALHNYFRAVYPTTGENEFWFSNFFIQKFLVIVGSNPLEFVKAFFNFFGHYGVQAFIFISAYGLTISYKKKNPPYQKFIIYRFNKVYPFFFSESIRFSCSPAPRH
jgi:peptidoglycan/LPS O-acetylase OafA/YrhL